MERKVYILFNIAGNFRIDRKIQTTDEEKYQSIKAHLLEELPGLELTPDFLYKAIFADNRRWLNQVKLFWMFQNIEATKEADRKHWKYKLKQFSAGVPCIHDVRTFTPKVEALIKSELFSVIKLDDFETEYCSTDKRLTEWFRDLRQRNYKSKFLKVAFGYSVTKNTQLIKFINKLLGKVGLKLRKSRKATDGTIYYRLDKQTVTDPDRIAVLQALTYKYELQQQAACQTQQQAIAVDEAIAVNEAELASNPIPVAEPKLNEWLSLESLEDIATWLEACQTPDDLNTIRQIAPAEALRLAARLLPPDKKELIRQWVRSGCEPPNQDYG